MKYKSTILIGEKVIKGETNQTISKKAGFNHRIVAKVLNGDEEVKISQVAGVADALGFDVQIEFKPKPETVAA